VTDSLFESKNGSRCYDFTEGLFVEKLGVENENAAKIGLEIKPDVLALFVCLTTIS